jgi:hypothetical protein
MQSRKIVPFCAGREQNYFVYGNDGEAATVSRYSRQANKTLGGKDQPERISQEEARVRTQNRVMLMPNLERVNAGSDRPPKFGSPRWRTSTRLLFIGHPTTEAADKRRCRWDERGEV